MSPSQARLLIIAGLLAAIQFIAVPLVEYQDELRSELSLLQRQVDRSGGLVEQLPVLQVQADKLDAAAKQVAQAFPDASNATGFRLEVQDQIQRLAREHGNQVTLFSWLAQPQAAGNNIQVQQARVNMSGNFRTLAQGQLALAEQAPYIRFIDASLRPQNRNPGANKQAELTLIIEVAGRSGGANAE
ncbi:hypothetical protein C9928_04085 [Pseudidiomarina aestuarii]|uniref:General secretion pathway protein GspM n=1 Tax=Pseudidiomarina aestuarii TaxID=624146 RepID=A0A2T4CNU6_9GAMM|nr:hypothetical protein C9986_00360 [Pseudidiomarina aestuarii]PTB85129.1 hypothetical protein C9988_02440 [Pseudidiomarina aestuarii]PTB89260.1 hypothetical protein C9928_04085 [Pseudidiomarina aestuarii]